jgi:hypothetical protein
MPIARRASVPWWWHLVLALILVISGSLVRWGQDDESPTEDEFAHLARGIAYWTTGDTRLSYAHPPLANALVTIGVASDDDIPDITTFTRSFDKRMDSGSVASGLIKKDYPSMRDKLLRAREAMTWVFLVGVAYAYFWALRIVGWPAAVAAAVFVGFNPTIIAQARYVTTDLPAGVAIAMAVGEFSRYLAGDGGRHTTWVTMPLALAGAILSKHSAALLAPMFVGVGFVVVLLRAGIFREHGRIKGLLRFAGHGAFAALVALLAINAAYRFQHTGLTVDEILERPEPRYWISSPYKGELLEEMTPLSKLPGSLPIPLPYTEIFGLGCIRAQNERGYPMSSFFGEPSKKGHWLYFPTLLLFKTPIVVLVLVLVGGPLALWRLRMRPPLAVTVVTVLALLFLAMSMRSNLNMGFRHALPVETMLCMVAAAIWGGAWAWLGDTPWRRGALSLPWPRWRSWGSRRARTTSVGSTTSSGASAGTRSTRWATTGGKIASSSWSWWSATSSSRSTTTSRPARGSSRSSTTSCATPRSSAARCPPRRRGWRSTCSRSRPGPSASSTSRGSSPCSGSTTTCTCTGCRPGTPRRARRRRAARRRATRPRSPSSTRPRPPRPRRRRPRPRRPRPRPRPRRPSRPTTTSRPPTAMTSSTRRSSSSGGAPLLGAAACRS